MLAEEVAALRADRPGLSVGIGVFQAQAEPTPIAFSSAGLRWDCGSMAAPRGARMLDRPPANAANILQTCDHRNHAKPDETTHADPANFGCFAAVRQPSQITSYIGEQEVSFANRYRFGPRRRRRRAASNDSISVRSCDLPAACFIASMSSMDAMRTLRPPNSMMSARRRRVL